MKCLSPPSPRADTGSRLEAVTALAQASYWSPARTDVMRCVLKPSQCIRPT
jgi:hypothetical protein